MRKHGKHGRSVLHVATKDTKSSLENFVWFSVLEEIQEKAPDMLDFIATVVWLTDADAYQVEEAQFYSETHYVCF